MKQKTLLFISELSKVKLGKIIANLSKSLDFEATEPADYNYCELIASDFLLGENCQHVGNTNWELYVMCVLKNKW